MRIEQALRRYIELVNTEKFAKYEKDFAAKIQYPLSRAYRRKYREEHMVLIIENIVNQVNGLSAGRGKLGIWTNSVFIHGPKSQVSFEYYEKRDQRELGDLIFVISVVYNGRKCFEKLTISQFKKDNTKTSWSLSPIQQLYLLSRFPSFQGVKGSLVPMKEYNLRNYSGCLGSYSLLYSPGDFAFLGAALLESYIGNRKSIKVADMFQMQEPTSGFFPWSPPFDLGYLHELIHILDVLFRHYGPEVFGLYPPFFIGFLGNSCYARHLHDFIDKYLRCCIGELTYGEIEPYNLQARIFFQELLSVVLRKAKTEGNPEIEKFVNQFFSYPYGDNEGGGIREGIESDFEGGGIGIIHTVVNLGEGE